MVDANTAVATQAAASAPKPPIAAGGRLAALVPQDIEQAFRIANALASTGDMIPKHFQNKPNEIMAAIMRGMEVGLAPMQALQHIAVINGRATIWGDAIPALLLRAGHFIDVELEGEADTLKATATLTRGDGRKVVRSFSMADAKKAGLAGKPGPWQQYPQRMCSMRARAWAARDGAADALMGLEIAEEVRDHIGPDNARDITPATPRRGGYVYADPAPARPVPEDATDAEEAAATGDLPTGSSHYPVTGEIIGDAQTATRREAAPAAGRRIDLDKIACSIRRSIADGQARSNIETAFMDELEAIASERPDLHAQIAADLDAIS